MSKFFIATMSIILSMAYVSFYVFLFWVVASVGTSALKKVCNECSSRYGIEAYYVNGNFFCTK